MFSRISFIFTVISQLVLILIIPCIAIGAETFLCTGGHFEKNEGDGDECVLYVRNETGISRAGCNDAAYKCYELAKSAGYSVGSVPKVSSIIVFDKGAPHMDPDNGHVAIVKEVNGDEIIIQDSNREDYHKIGSTKIDTREFIVNGVNYILGYIYCDGDSSDTNSIIFETRTVGEIGWYPTNKTCINAERWFRIANYNETKRIVQEFTDNSACFLVNPVPFGVYNILFGENDLPLVCTQ